MIFSKSCLRESCYSVNGSYVGERGLYLLATLSRIQSPQQVAEGWGEAQVPKRVNTEGLAATFGKVCLRSWPCPASGKLGSEASHSQDR